MSLPFPNRVRQEGEKETFRIVRFYHGGARYVRQTGLTLEQARAHCKRPETSGKGWFDGYESETREAV